MNSCPWQQYSYRWLSGISRFAYKSALDNEDHSYLWHLLAADFSPPIMETNIGTVPLLMNAGLSIIADMFLKRFENSVADAFCNML